MTRILLAIAALAAPCAGTAAGAGTDPVNAFGRPASTRAEAIGGAATALGRDAGLVWSNPAAPALTANSSLMLAGSRGFFGDAAGQGLLTSPFPGGVLAFGIAYFDAGRASLYTSEGARRNMDTQQDFMGSLTWSRAFAAGLSAGLTVKGLNSVLFGENTSSAVAADAGVQYRVCDFLKVGAAARNLGTPLKYGDDRIGLPSSASAGAMFGARVGKRDALLLTCDFESSLRTAQPAWSAGAEYQRNGFISLRAGARLPSSAELGRWTAGAGIVFNRYRLDYGVRFDAGFDNPQTLSLTMVFPSFIQTVTVPAARPAGAAPPPAEPPAPGENELQIPETGGIGGDLNRELDELMKQKKEK